jgi:hypothetical protein
MNMFPVAQFCVSASNWGVKIHDPWCQCLRSARRRRVTAVALVRVTGL